MKTKIVVFFFLLICNLLPAQNIELDIVPHYLGVRADSLFLSMDISIDINDMNSKSSVVLTPVLAGQDREVLLPSIQLNGKQKQKLYLRNQILRKKSNDDGESKTYLVAGIDESHSRTIAYHISLAAENWMSDASVFLRRSIIKSGNEKSLKDTLLIASQNPSSLSGISTWNNNSTPSVDALPSAPTASKAKYKGTYVSPETDDIDIRNQKELNFSLEEARIMVDINPQMLSLRELYTVALAYTEDKAKFYQIINLSVQLYPVHPIANLNAAAAAIEQGDAKSAYKFLSVAFQDTLAYKNCRGVYELMSGNIYEGIRILKAAKAEGSEEAAYNLKVFFESSKRP